jgi:hypothetical protein
MRIFELTDCWLWQNWSNRTTYFVTRNWFTGIHLSNSGIWRDLLAFFIIFANVVYFFILILIIIILLFFKFWNNYKPTEKLVILMQGTIFLLNYFRINCQSGLSSPPSISMCAYSKDKGVFLYNHKSTKKIRGLTLTQLYHLILRSHGGYSTVLKTKRILFKVVLCI